MSRQIITPARSVAGELTVPGDKSISHRAVLIASVGDGDCRIGGLSTAEDVEASRGAMEALGVVISNDNPQVESLKQSTRRLDRELLVEGRGWDGLKAPATTIFCQNSGTTARTLLGVLAGRPFKAQLDGDASLRGRPMARVVDPLRQMGASIAGEGEHLPLEISGGGLRGIGYASRVASAQVKTALILAGMQAAGETVYSEPEISRDHTERILKYLGASIEESADQLIIKSTYIQNASSLSVPGDLSSAAFALVAAAILPGSEVTITGVGLNPTRTGILDVLTDFGAAVEIEGLKEVCGEPRGTVTVRAGDRRPIQVAGGLIVRTIDELPLVGVLGAFAEGETVVRDAAELRVKESDRIATLAAGLEALGARVETFPDGMSIKGPSKLRGAAVDPKGDHRIAMALAVAALGAEGQTEVSGWEAVGVSYPEFLSDLESLIER
jgi:3-phosphoshikimate 1-carboxyvinyltransferase